MLLRDKIIQKVFLILILLLVSNICFSQVKDSVSSVQNVEKTILSKVEIAAANKFPITRLLNIEYSKITPYKTTHEYLGSDLPAGKVTNLHLTRISANVALIKGKRWAFGTTLNYRHISIEADGINFFSDPTKLNRYQEEFNYHSSSLHLTYFTKLFNKTVVYSGTASVDGSEQHFERLRGMVTGTMVLKATPQTKMTIGIVGLIDPSALVPSFIRLPAKIN